MYHKGKSNVDIGDGCHELFTQKKPLATKLGSINMRPDMASNVSVGCHSFGNIMILGDIFVRSKYLC